MSTEHIRAIELGRYFAGELGGADAERVRLHTAECAECGAGLAELEAERRRFLNLHPFEEFARSRGIVKSIGNANNKKRFTEWMGAPLGRYGVVFAAAAALMLVPLALTTYLRKSPADDNYIESPAVGGIRYKGAERLSFMLMRDGETRLGSPLEAYRAGDKLQVIYSYPKSHHAALFSVDNAGTVSFYANGAGDSLCSVPADSGSDLAFPSSIVLDDSRGEELVVMLISGAPVSAERVSDVVRRLSKGNYADLPGIEDKLRRGGLGRGVSVSSVRIKKE